MNVTTHSRPSAIWKVGAKIKSTENSRTLALILTFILLLTIGMFNLYSASFETSHFWSQAKHLPIALLAFVIVGWGFPLKFFQNYAYLAHIGIVLLLVLVLLLGHTAGGSQRWLNIGFMRLQPSELAKITIALASAKWFAAGKIPAPFQPIDTWPIVVSVGVVFILIFLQPDLGTAGICALVGMSQILFLIKIDKKLVGLILSGAIFTGVVGWNFLLHSYQKLRIMNLLNPQLDPSGSSYNSLQSLVAVGSGGMWGKGYLQGTQTQLQFLPERHTDFIFSAFAEENGFIGGSLVFLLFGLLLYLGLSIARNSKDMFGSLLAVGIVALLFFEFAINVAMVLSLFPVVGMPLPLFSKGGSATLSICIGIGLLVAVERQKQGANRKIKLERSI